MRELQTRQGGRAEAHEDEETPLRAAAAKAKAKSKGKKGGDKDVWPDLDRPQETSERAALYSARCLLRWMLSVVHAMSHRLAASSHA